MPRIDTTWGALLLLGLSFGCAGRSTPVDGSEEGRVADPASQAAEVADLVGFYTLAVEPGVGWQRHFLAIDSQAEGQVRGRLQIDRSIGPEARMPTPDERTHLMAFETAQAADGGFEVTVHVGELAPVAWTVALVPKPTEVGRPVLSGIYQVEVGHSEQKGAATATPAERPAEIPWPEWGELPRGDQGASTAAPGLQLPGALDP